MTHYDVLDIPESASSEQIRNAYRRLVKKYHPDKNPSEEATAVIRQLNAAYEVLSDPEKRSVYDQQSYLALAFVVEEEDPREILKRERARKDWEQQQADEERKELKRRSAFRVLRQISFPVLALSLVLLTDILLPAERHKEIGYWAVPGILTSNMQTRTFYIEVPSILHTTYNYDDPDTLSLMATPILRRVSEGYVNVHGTQYEWFSTGYLIENVVYILLLMSAAFTAFKKDYSAMNYSLSFLPIALFIVALMFLLGQG